MKRMIKLKPIVKTVHMYLWVIQIPFVFYFASTLAHIEGMNNEIEMMGEILDKEYENSRETVLALYRNSKRNALWNKKFIKLYNSAKDPMDFVLGPEFINSLDWENEIKNVKEEYVCLFKKSDRAYYGWDSVKEYKDALQIDPWIIQWSIKYPELRKQVANMYGKNMTIMLASYLGTPCGMVMCPYFTPVIQERMCGSYLYPRQYNACDNGKPHFKINGHSLDNNMYQFKPIHKGVHEINVEFEYMYNGSMHTFRDRMRLQVE